MIDPEPDRVPGGTLLALFVFAVISAGVIVACAGWGATVFSPPGVLT
jgi:hypothetical protein